MNRFKAKDVEITVKNMKTKVVINGTEIPTKSISFYADINSAPTVTLELPIFPEGKNNED